MIELDYLGMIEDAEEAVGFEVDAVYVERDGGGSDEIMLKKSHGDESVGLAMQYDGGKVALFEHHLEHQLRGMAERWEERFA